VHPQAAPSEANQKGRTAAAHWILRRSGYLILASLNSTCLRIFGSYLRNDIFSVVFREFLRVV
jgi:hypothetical protein